MKRKVEKYLYDVKESINLIQSYLLDVDSAEAYYNNTMLMDAIERRLAIIGEAIFKADKVHSALPITNKYKIIALRHILVHEYDLIEKEAIWEITVIFLPILKEEIEAYFNSLSK